MAKSNTDVAPKGSTGMGDSDAEKAFKHLNKLIKHFPNNFESITARFPKNKRPRFFSRFLKLFSESGLKKPQVSNYDLGKAFKTEELVKNNPPNEFFTKDNNKQVQDLRIAIRNFKNAFKNWGTNPYLKLKVEFLEKAVLLYEQDKLCHQSEDLFKEYEELFDGVGFPNLSEK